MKRIPRHVIARNRNNSLAEEQAQGYPERPGSFIERGPCARCRRLEVDHFAGSCEDWKPYEPPVAEGSVQNV